MTIVIAGGSGFLGRPLTDRLVAAGHQVALLSRRATPTDTPQPGAVRVVEWTPDGHTGAWAAALEGADAVVNLAGESIADKRWTATQKARILDSRVLATRSLAQAIGVAAAPPALFLSASGVGYYGPLGDEPAPEETPPGRDFLAGVCVRWEAEAERAASARTRVATLRTGLVLARDGGALPKMLLPFRLGAGGPIGSGRQYWPWIHWRDWIDLVHFIIGSPDAAGPVNATAPAPVTNRDFARALGSAMHRPSIMPTPGFALRALLGEMADGLLLSGQRAVPAKAERLGFTFRYPTLDLALAELFRP